MATKIKSKISPKNKYYIPELRYKELLYFCRQYQYYKDQLKSLWSDATASNYILKPNKENPKTDNLELISMKIAVLTEKIKIIEESVLETDWGIREWLLKGVTEGKSYNELLYIPCSRDYYYRNYRKFFWILDQKKE